MKEKIKDALKNLIVGIAFVILVVGVFVLAHNTWTGFAMLSVAIFSLAKELYDKYYAGSIINYYDFFFRIIGGAIGIYVILFVKLIISKL